MRSHRSKTRPIGRLVRTAAILATSLLLTAGCAAMNLFTPDPDQAAADQQLKTVKTVMAAKQKIGESPEQVGDIVPSRQYEVAVKTEGEVEEVFKKRGETVQEGDVLLKLSSKESQFQTEKLAFNVDNAKNALEKAKKDLQNNRAELLNSIAKAELNIADMTRSTNKLKNDFEAGKAKRGQAEQAETQLKNAKLDLDLMKQRLKALDSTNSLVPLESALKAAELALQEQQQSLEKLAVRAPASGILTDMAVDKGVPVKAGEKVGIIQNLDPIRVKAQLSEETVKLVRGKQELSFYLPGSTNLLTGKVSYLAPVVDPQTKTYELSLELDNKDQALKPGMKARVKLTDDQEQMVLAVPVSSVVKKELDSYVFVVKGDSVERRLVQLGRMGDDDFLQEVISGVQEGEQVVISGQTQLKDRDKVQVASMDTTKK